MRISDWSSDVCSSDLAHAHAWRTSSDAAAGVRTGNLGGYVPVHGHFHVLLMRNQTTSTAHWHSLCPIFVFPSSVFLFIHSGHHPQRLGILACFFAQPPCHRSK